MPSLPTHIESLPTHIEPLRWKKPDGLLQRHGCYKTLKPIPDSKLESIHPFDRLHEITVTVAPDGKAAVNWKQRKDRP